MCTRIVIRRGQPFVERRGPRWASILSAVMFLAWVVVSLYAAAFADVFTLVWASVLLLVPALALSYTVGYRKRSRIKAIVEARQVPGGAHVVVMDDRNQRHEFVMGELAAVGLANVLSESAR